MTSKVSHLLGLHVSLPGAADAKAFRPSPQLWIPSHASLGLLGLLDLLRSRLGSDTWR